VPRQPVDRRRSATPPCCLKSDPYRSNSSDSTDTMGARARGRRIRAVKIRGRTARSGADTTRPSDLCIDAKSLQADVRFSGPCYCWTAVLGVCQRHDSEPGGLCFAVRLLAAVTMNQRGCSNLRCQRREISTEKSHKHQRSQYSHLCFASHNSTNAVVLMQLTLS